jgi:hypothetical protein
MTVTTDDLRRLGVDDQGSLSPVNTPSLNQWLPASNLKPGEHLKTTNGATVTVVGGTVPKQRDGWMWDLTVPGNNDHDFYVLAASDGNGPHAYNAITRDTPVLVHNASCPRFVVDSNGGINDLNGPQAQIQINKMAGDGFRDDVAAYLRSIGRTVVTDDMSKGALTFTTPYGPRTFDIGVWDDNGNLLGYVEAKTGSSPYTALQQDKDAWLSKQYGYKITVIRAP